eukprot:jgi/Tetstr1/434600/TSEL_023691.t1
MEIPVVVVWDYGYEYMADEFKDRVQPGDNEWQFCIDLHVLNTYCALKRLRMDTLMGLRHPTNKGDGMFSFDLKDDFVALGIAPSD